MTPVLSALFFLVDYLLFMLVCGTVTWRLVCLKPSAEGAEASEGAKETRRDLALFLVGTGFAPFAMGLTQGALLLVAAGLPRLAYGLVHLGLAAAVLILMRRSLRLCMGRCGTYLKGLPLRGAPVLVPLFAIGIVAFYTAMASGQPTLAHDATIYALDARRLAERRSAGALMTWTPDEDNHVACHNHGASYAYYLSTALLFGRDVREDFPLRVAQQVLTVHVFLCLAGVGLCVSGVVALLVPVLLLMGPVAQVMMRRASRDPYRLLPMLLVLGLAVKLGRKRWDWAAVFLLLGAFAFLWNSHAASLLIAPTLLAGLLLCRRRWRSRAVLAALFSFGLLLGGSRLIEATVRTGSPTRDSLIMYKQYEGTPMLKAYFGSRAPWPPGVTNGLAKLRHQLSGDGRILGMTLFVSLAAMAAWIGVSLVRRGRVRPPPPLILAAGVFVLLFEAQIVGLFDWFEPRVSGFLTMNQRYRLPVYPVAALVSAWLLAEATRLPAVLAGRLGWSRWEPRSMRLWSAGAGAALLLIAGVARVHGHWGLNRTVCLRAAEGDALLSRSVGYAWLPLFRAIPRDELILMEEPYAAWYHTDNRVISYYEPRIWPAIRMDDPKEVVAYLDTLGVRYICLRVRTTLPLLSQVAFGRALASDAYEIVLDNGYWRILRRRERGRQKEEG